MILTYCNPYRLAIEKGRSDEVSPDSCNEDIISVVILGTAPAAPIQTRCEGLSGVVGRRRVTVWGAR